MSVTYLMSYPSPQWHIRGAANFRSQSKEPTNPRAAMKEWLALADAITRAGGHILVMAPPDQGEPLTGLMYCANHGALFKDGDRFTFLISKMSVAHRQNERAHIRAFFEKAGLPIAEASHTWEGQADVTTLGGSRYLLTYGVRSVRESLEEVRTRLPRGSRSLDIQLREPWFHGDTCLNPLVNRAGDTTLLAFGGALVNRGVPELRTFIDRYGEVISVEEEDALGYACNALSVNGTALLPRGLSAGLRGQLVRRGLIVEELDLPELFGKGGGGPRCLVNELRGFVLTDEAPGYVTERDALYALAEKYPESSPQKTP
jgi:N-dimethylarginine dimethylaminohydrolase